MPLQHRLNNAECPPKEPDSLHRKIGGRQQSHQVESLFREHKHQQIPGLGTCHGSHDHSYSRRNRSTRSIASRRIVHRELWPLALNPEAVQSTPSSRKRTSRKHTSSKLTRGKPPQATLNISNPKSWRWMVQMRVSFSKRGGSLGSSRYFSAVYHVFFFNPSNTPKPISRFHATGAIICDEKIGGISTGWFVASRGFLYHEKNIRQLVDDVHNSKSF